MRVNIIRAIIITGAMLMSAATSGAEVSQSVVFEATMGTLGQSSITILR